MTGGEFTLEVVNGNWGLVSLSLMVICLMYFGHEAIALRVYGRGWRDRLTLGMRVSVALFTLSLGVFIRSAETWRWRISGEGIAGLNQFALQVGGAIAVVGFLCAIREISIRIFGRGPWVWTLVAMVVFNVVSVLLHFR